MQGSPTDVAAGASESRYSTSLESVRAWLDRHLGQFMPAGTTLDGPTVKPAVEMLFVLRGLRRAKVNPASHKWIDSVVDRLWDPAEAWLRRLRWSGLVNLARTRSPSTANLLLIPLLEDLAGRRSIAHERVRLVFAEIPWRDCDDLGFDLAFACDLTDVRPSQRLARRQLRRLVADQASLHAQPSAYYDLTHAIFLETSMGQRRARCPGDLRPELDHCLARGLASRLRTADLDLSCELAVAATWSLPDPSAPLRAGIHATLCTVAQTTDAHGCVPCLHERAVGSPFTFAGCYHQTLVALLALACAADLTETVSADR